MMNFTNVIKPQFMWNESSFHSTWDVGQLPFHLLNHKQLMVKFCPLFDREHAAGTVSESWSSTSDDVMDHVSVLPPVWVDVGWVMKIVFASINFATTQQVTTDVAVDIINKVTCILGFEIWLHQVPDFTLSSLAKRFVTGS